MRIELTPEERDLLREVLERNLNEVDLEIHRADTLGFKDMLKQRKQSLENIIKKVDPAPVPV